MRKIICRFRDEAEFFSHLRNRLGAGGDATLSFLGRFGLEPGEEARVLVLISSVRENLKIGVRIRERRRVAIDAGDTHEIGAGVWSYRAEIAAEDRPWVDMFVAKLSTLKKLDVAERSAA